MGVLTALTITTSFIWLDLLIFLVLIKYSLNYSIIIKAIIQRFYVENKGLRLKILLKNPNIFLYHFIGPIG